MGAVYDDLPGHEGYATRDQHERGWSAACSCGWLDYHQERGDSDGYDAAVDRWDAIHAAPLLERAVPVDVAELAALAAERPLAAANVIDQLERWQTTLKSRTIGVPSRTRTVQERLDALAARAARSERRLGR